MIIAKQSLSGIVVLFCSVRQTFMRSHLAWEAQKNSLRVIKMLLSVLHIQQLIILVANAMASERYLQVL